MTPGGLDISGEYLPVEVTVRQIDATVVVTVSGEIDMFTVPAIEAALKATVTVGVGRVVVDLSAVTFFGACAVDTLVAARRMLRENGAELEVRDPSPPVQRVLTITDAEDALVVRSSGDSRNTHSGFAESAERTE